jgi:hypothetical protein
MSLLRLRLADVGRAALAGHAGADCQVTGMKRESLTMDGVRVSNSLELSSVSAWFIPVRVRGLLGRAWKTFQHLKKINA